MKKTAIALALLASLGVTSTAMAKPISPEKLTCKEYLATKTEHLPELTYWLDGFDSRGHAVVSVDEEWFAVPITDVVSECKKMPDALAMDILRNHHGKHVSK